MDLTGNRNTKSSNEEKIKKTLKTTIAIISLFSNSKFPSTYKFNGGDFNFNNYFNRTFICSEEKSVKNIY